MVNAKHADVTFTPVVIHPPPADPPGHQTNGADHLRARRMQGRRD